MLKVVIDTNIFISALLFGGKPRDIVELARSRVIFNATSTFIVDEVEGVLVVKFFWEPRVAETVTAGIMDFSEVVIPKDQVDIVRDCQADNRIVECALESGAHFIISGDRHLTELKEYRGIMIVDPNTFMRVITDR